MSPLPPTRERSSTVIRPDGLSSASAKTVSVPGHPGGRRWVKRILIGFAIVLAVAIGAAGAFVWIGTDQIQELVKPKSAATREAQTKLEAPLPGKPANVLVMGSDRRSGSASNDRRSDTLLLVRLDPQGKTISMLSFPRDTYVDIPGHGQSKINDAFSLGGPALTVETVKKLTGLDINFIAVVDFKGFREIVDTFGGVWIDVDRRYFNDNSSGGGDYATIDIEPGYQLLGGRDALDFARYRHTDSDFHRIARQQQMLASLKKQAGKSDVVKNIPGLFGTLKRNTDMATGGNGTVPARVIIDYMRLALTLNPDAIKQVELECGIDMTAAGASIVVCNQDTIDAAVDAFLDPSDSAKQQAIANLTGEKAAPTTAKSPKAVPPKGLIVEVKNGNGVPGAATSAATELRKLGYTVRLQPGTAGNADRQDYTNTQIQYSDPKWESAANILAESIPNAEVMALQDATATKAGILVIVGQEDAIGSSQPNGSSTSSVAAPDSAKIPEKSTPKVTTDTEYGLAEMQAMQAQSGIRMPLMYPTVRESSSTYPDAPRAYKIQKGKSVYDAYRLVGRTAGSDYWGLQGTMWPDPPILDDPSREITRGSRTYLLFFNGTRLHRVAWRENGAVYWVSNSVLDKLSNETMLAIAEGVKPVPK